MERAPGDDLSLLGGIIAIILFLILLMVVIRYVQFPVPQLPEIWAPRDQQIE